MLPTGGFGDNPQMIQEMTGYKWGEDLFSMRSPRRCGDGIRMAWEAGAARGHMEMERIMSSALPDSAIFKPLFDQPNLTGEQLG